MHYSKPYAYMITYRTYGSWLHGDPRFSVHHTNTVFHSPKIQPNQILHQQMKNNLLSAPVKLNETMRGVVLQGILRACNQYQWQLFAAHVRSNHVHLVVKALTDPERIMNQTKAFATRMLRKNKLIEKSEKCWARHGSTKYIWNPDMLQFAMYYVVEEQGKKMACYFEDWFDDEVREEMKAVLDYYS